MKITLRNLSSFCIAVLFAGALLALAIPSLRPFFRSSAADALGSAKAPVWELKDPDGKLVKSSDFDGKVVILDFWATWCPPCKAEIPGFIELQKTCWRSGYGHRARAHHCGFLAQNTAVGGKIGANPHMAFRSIARTGQTNVDDHPENHLLP